MSSNFVAGLVSGIDTTALIDALVTSRSGPITLLQQRQAEKTAQLSAWKTLEATLIGLKVETERLGKASLWDTPRVSSSDEEILSAAADSTAALGSYDLFVQQLAQSHQLQSVAYGARSQLVGNGTLSISVGSVTTDLTVAAGTTLEGLASQINTADLGASAAIVRSSTGGAEEYYLVLTADETGTGSQLTVTSGLAGGTDPVLATEVRAAQNAQIAFGGEGGLVLESTTNTFENIVDGVDVTVARAMASGERLTVTVDRDSEGLEDAVAAFVDSYNAVLSFVNEQYNFDPDVGKRPPLMGDGSLTTVVGSVRSLVTRPLAGAMGTYRSLHALGIRSSANGTLTFDRDAFQDALGSDFDAVADLFRANVSFDAAGIRLASAPQDVELGNRQFSVEITQAATRATITGASLDLAAGLTIDATNDTFRIEIDGILSESLTIAHGTYTDGAALAAAVQAAIEGSQNLGSSGARVSFEGSGATGSLVLDSEGYGSERTLKLLTSGTSQFASATGLSGSFNTLFAGTDVAGTIDGIVAEGKGQILGVPADDEELGGLSFLVTSSAPTTYAASATEGVGRTVSRRLAELTDSVDGSVARISGSIQRMIESIDKDIAAKQDQLEEYRAQLQRRYARMETILGELQSQGQFLSAQIQSMTSGSSGIGTTNG